MFDRYRQMVGRSLRSHGKSQFEDAVKASGGKVITEKEDNGTSLDFLIFDEATEVTERTTEVLLKMIDAATPHIADRYFDDKNAVKGSHLKMQPSRIYDWIVEEADECRDAFKNKEGVARELEELGDNMLLSLFRMDQILKSREV